MRAAGACSTPALRDGCCARTAWLGLALVVATMAPSAGGCERAGASPDSPPAPREEEGATAAESSAKPEPDAWRAQLAAELGRAYPRAAPAVRAEHRFELVAAPAEVQQFDGRLLRVWAYDGQVPGPVLRVRLGERVRVTLRNRLPQPTTIHWHGVRVPNAMDGVPGVTQPPVAPGESFEYSFVPKDAGTFWFHPHVRGSEQVERGLYGVLVVEDAEPKPYSADVVWVLDDWRLGPDGEVDPRFVTRHDLMHDGRWGQTITVNGSIAEELPVRAGQRLRLRLVNTSNGRVYLPDFGALDAKVIAVDGMYTARPLPAEGFTLAPGNRLDLDVTVPHAAAGQALVVHDRFTRRPHPLATLRVGEDTVETPDFAPPSNPAVPRWRTAVDAPIDVRYVLDARRGGPHGIEWTINGKPWGDHEVTELSPGRFVRVRFQNDSFRLHPMHLHGQFFKVIARNGQAVDEPYFRDTVLLQRKESVDVGMVPVDWGKWLLHCHILEHAEAGMRTLVEVGEGGGEESEGSTKP